MRTNGIVRPLAMRTQRTKGGYRRRVAVVGVPLEAGSNRHNSANPAYAIGANIARALDPRLAPLPVETLAKMTPEKRAEMLRLYGKK